MNQHTLSAVTPEEFCATVFSLQSVNRLSEKWQSIDAALVREIIMDFFAFAKQHGGDFDALEGKEFHRFVDKMTPALTSRGVPQRYVRTMLDTILDDARLEISRLARHEAMMDESV